MLSERITLLFEYLSCTNSDVARCAECSSSLISRLRSGNRIPKPSSPSVMMLSEGVYCFADKHNLLDTLCKLCNTEMTNREQLILSLIGWLYETDKISIPPSKKQKSLSNKKNSILSFGDRLNAVMTMLNLPNSRLARLLNVDNSHISRFRNGVRSPISNPKLSLALATILLTSAEKAQKINELSSLTNISSVILTEKEECVSFFYNWLFEIDENTTSSSIDAFLEHIDNIPSASPSDKLPLTNNLFNIKTAYKGIDGIREAVIRFLSDAAKIKDGELLLYSDQAMDWLIGDDTFLSRWKALMLACVKNRTQIKIIHNMERGAEELLAAISSWLPLYLSGRIESYVCRQKGDMRFSHTIFLCPNTACVFGAHVRSAENDGWYDYITEQDRINACQMEYDYLLSQAEPLIRLFFDGESFRIFNRTFTNKGDCFSLLSTLSIASMQKDLLVRILDRNNIVDAARKYILASYDEKRQNFIESLKSCEVLEFLPLVKKEILFEGFAQVNLSELLIDTNISYTPEEFAEHINEIIRLHNEYPSYKLFILPETPFLGIQIMKNSEHVDVIKRNEPKAAFVFTNSYMLHAFDEYFITLKKKYSSDRNDTRAILKKLYLT